jgi:polar amino acid transport system permease protein
LLGYQFQWDVVWRYRDAFAHALALSAGLAAAALVIGALAGLAIAYGALAKSRPIRLLAIGYVELVRNTPLLLLVFFLYLVLPELGFRLLGKLESFVLALSVVSSAYLAENFRASLGSFPAGYREAAKALALTPIKTELLIVLPIALRYSLPAVTNSLIAIFKDTSLASVVAIPELTFVAREVETNYFRVIEAWTTVCGIYMVVCGALALQSRWLERRLPKLS